MESTRPYCDSLAGGSTTGRSARRQANRDRSTSRYPDRRSSPRAAPRDGPPRAAPSERSRSQEPFPSAPSWSGPRREAPLRSRPRHVHLLAGDEFEQHRRALLRLLDAALDGRHDVGRLGDALAIAAEGARHGGVVTRDVGGTVLLRRDWHHLELDRHAEIVEQDRHDRDALAHGGLEI